MNSFEREIDSMSEIELMKVIGFDETDLAANRLGQLTKKQNGLLAQKAQKHKTLYTAIGIVIVLMVGVPLVTSLFSTVLSLIGAGLLNGALGMPTEAAFTITLVSVGLVVCIGGPVLLVAAGAVAMVLKIVFGKANRKTDLTVCRAEGKVNFVWVERQERNTSKHGPMYHTVRSLEMRVGTENTFSNVNSKLPSLINQGEEWVLYYTKHPFTFLSAERIGQ